MYALFQGNICQRRLCYIAILNVAKLLSYEIEQNGSGIINNILFLVL